MTPLLTYQGTLVANDFKKGRVKALQGNLMRLGVSCAVVVNADGREFPKLMGGFDRVLLDAPCAPPRPRPAACGGHTFLIRQVVHAFLIWQVCRPRRDLEGRVDQSGEGVRRRAALPVAAEGAASANYLSLMTTISATDGGVVRGGGGGGGGGGGCDHR